MADEMRTEAPDSVEGRDCTAPTLKGDLNSFQWGPNGDPILCEMGTLNSRNGDPKSVYLKN